MYYTDPRTGETHTVKLEPQSDGSFVAIVDGRIYHLQVRSQTDGGWQITNGNQRHIVHAASQGDQRYVYLDDKTYTLTVNEQQSTRRRAHSGSSDLTAQMPGQVAQVLVEEGQTVERGQTLIILEAMKMEIRVTAHEAGRIKRLLVKASEVVQRGQVLVEIG